MAGYLGHEPTTLQDLLRDEGIELHEPARPGGKDHGGPRSKLFCPACSGGKHRERNFFVKIDPDANGFRWVCHRASCAVTGGRRLHGTGTIKVGDWKPKTYRRPEPPQVIHRPDPFLAYFAGFGISARTVEALGIYRGENTFAVVNLETGKETERSAMRPCIVYPYREQGALLNNKYKAIFHLRDGLTLKRFKQDFDHEPSLYNIDAFATEDVGYFVEGEDDVAAMVECGFRQTTTLADGSPGKLSEHYDPLTDDDRRYEALRGNAKIAALKRLVLAGDADQAGRNHHEEIARRVGKARCWQVTWPEGCKDAKDTLQKRGRDAVLAAVRKATPYPIEGLEIVPEEQIYNRYHGIGSAYYDTGQPILDSRLRLRDSGMLCATTGIPGHGKTAFWTSYAVLLALAQDARMSLDSQPFHTVIFSAETSNDQVVADLVSQHSGKSFYPVKDRERLTYEEVLDAKVWADKHFAFVKWDKRGEQPTSTWVKERIADSIRRFGTKLAIIDPWQEIDDEMPQTWRKTHSEWIGKVLQGWVGFAADMRINIIIVAHPPKPAQRNKDGSLPIPGGYDIANSQAFYSRCDLGVTIHRPDHTTEDMLLRVWKSKNKLIGQVGDTTLRYDGNTHRILPRPVSADALDDPALMRGRWSMSDHHD